MRHFVPAPGAPGYTMTELIVAVAIAGVLAAIAAPSYNSAILNSRLTSSANDLVSTALLARGEAIKRNATLTLCASSDGASCAADGGWEQGYILTCPESPTVADTCNIPPAVSTSTLVIASHQATTGGMQISEADDLMSLSFRPTGSGTTPAVFTICRSEPLGSSERVVRIGSTGRATVTKTATGTCP